MSAPANLSHQETGSIASKDKVDEKDFSDASTVEIERPLGVVRAEILARQWNTWYHKAILLFSAFLVGYAYGLDGQIRWVFTGYATQLYAAHSLLATIGVITAFIAAGAQPVYARLSDIFGRLEIFLASIVFYIVGTIIESQADTVQKYAAGSVFYQIGYTGAILVVLFIVSDFSSLKWRLFFSFTPTFPFIINTWISGDVKNAVGDNWKWGIAMWAFIYPLACLPLVGCMIHMRWLAGKTEEWKQFKTRTTKYQELGPWGFAKYLFHYLDVIGITLLLVFLGCILIPLSLSGTASIYGLDTSKWRKADTLAPIIIGILLIPVFVFWEAKFAKHPIFPVFMLKERGIWSVLIISFLLNTIGSIESSYLYAVLMVAVGESDKSATRISGLNSFVSVVGGFFFGIFVVYFRRLKGFIIFGCSMWILAFGLLIKFRAGDAAHAGIIGALCVLGFGTTFFTYPISVSAQAACSHDNMAVVISLIYTVYRVGASVGSAIAGAVWGAYLESQLYKNLSSELAFAAYTAPYTYIATWEWGTPERDGIVDGYKKVQRILMIIAIVLCVPMTAAAFFLRDPKLGDEQSIENIEQKQQNEKIFSFIKGGFKKSDPQTEKAEKV